MLPGLYIHVPFCVRKCRYCDFYSIADLSAVDVYMDALIAEMQMQAAGFKDAFFDTIYLGGGTPSVLGPGRTGRVLEAAAKHFHILPGAEITLEANPGTLAARSLAQYRSAGVSRINIGVQSFNDANLSFLGRIHCARQAADALRAAEKAGFSDIGLDLIYGLPGQGRDSWQKDLEAAAGFCPAHVSCYMLTYEPGTRLSADKDAGRIKPLSEDRVSAMFVQAQDFFAEKGYQHYEISNFAVHRAKRSRHNQKYWNNASYLGLGPAAHSYTEPERFWNHADLSRYIRDLSAGRLPTAASERLTDSQMMIEAVYLGLRQSDGIDVALLEKRFNRDFGQMFGSVIRRFEETGHMRISHNRCRLTSRGMLFLDSIAAEMAGVI
ncbi:oxygen-independent coproporphyrinogen-3 oxidase [Desulfosalsimonas propionicica]|uniref:Heme chaperone HemW n=1 Tax=Desulfosalsimonas propionicica TaxID=332175 RepID=A0A7W0CCA0_9BACT|nr:radical SAM family heme chaperone HemW [Desulfosalsimonas propionicica]MBA2883080.1 oxygen-independent coproporphyrinogen-3 oxidase [Desulfosalsimonas propionicica]